MISGTDTNEKEYAEKRCANVPSYYPKPCEEARQIVNDEEEPDDSMVLSEQDLKLVKLITNQIRMKKINLDAFIDDDNDEYDVDKALEDYESYSAFMQQQQQQQPLVVEEPDHRLSTILEVSREESPMKKLVVHHKVEASKSEPESVPEEEEHVVEDATLANPPLDIDSIPIGGKSTNKMSFEELIEESLKKQDQLDMEQQKRSTKKRPLVKKQPYVQKSAKEVPASNPRQAQPKPAPKPVEVPEVIAEAPPVEVAQSSGVKPRVYLKRGEGLKRYQPPAPTKPQQAAETVSQKPVLKSVSSAAFSQSQPQPKVIKKSQSVTNMTRKQSVQQQQQQPAKLLHSKSTSRMPSSTASANVKPETSVGKLKPAVQFNTTEMPRARVEPVQTRQPTSSDEELKEFETLEQYVDEHPSFRSSVSFVENVVLHSNKPSKASNANNKANKFAYMLNLLNSNNSCNSKKLADLLEEELNELNNSGGGGVADRDKEEPHEENDNGELAELSRSNASLDSSSLLNTSNASSGSERRRRSQSESSASSRPLVVRKIKRIEPQQQHEEDTSEEAGEAELKKAYSCFNYEDDGIEKRVELNFDLYDNEEQEYERAQSTARSVKLTMPKTSSRSSSQESVKPHFNERKSVVKFDDKHSWLDTELQPATAITTTANVAVTKTFNGPNEEKVNCSHARHLFYLFRTVLSLCWLISLMSTYEKIFIIFFNLFN